MKTALSILVVSLIVFLFVYNPKKLVNFVSSIYQFDKLTDITYGELDRQKLDIYLPKKTPNKSGKQNVVVVFFHGGGWKLGNKNENKFVASRLTNEGYTVLIPNYRLFPEVTFPAFVHDAALSISWLHNNHEKYSINAKNVYLMGYSAGAHIACLLTTDQKYLSNMGLKKNYIAGFIGLSGPYDFLPMKSESRKKIFPEKFRFSSQPIQFVDGEEPPFLLLHGKEDKVVLPKNSTSLAKKIQSKGGSVVLRIYEEIDHSSIMAPFVIGFNKTAPTVDDIVMFINSTKKDDMDDSESSIQ